MKGEEIPDYSIQFAQGECNAESGQCLFEMLAEEFTELGVLGSKFLSTITSKDGREVSLSAPVIPANSLQVCRLAVCHDCVRSAAIWTPLRFPKRQS